MSRVLPILFNTEMVRAILDGRKTATRRLIKPQPTEHLTCGNNWKQLLVAAAAPYQPGDILYVRESVFQGVGHYLDVSGETVSVLTNDFEYYADGLHEKDHWKDKYERTWMHRRPSIHMPKEAARIWLKVKEVRVERLQEITEVQAEAEGIRGYSKDGNLYKYAVTDDWWIDYHNKHRKSFIGTWWQDMPRTAKDAFSYLWNSTIKKADLDRYGWDANPWVWVIEFERCENPDKVKRNGR